MKFKLAAVNTINGELYASVPSGQYCDQWVTIKNGLSLEEFEPLTIPSQVALYALMNKWHAQFDGKLHKIIAKDGAICVQTGNDSKDATVIKHGNALQTAYAERTPSEKIDLGPEKFIGGGKPSGNTTPKEETK